MVPQVFDASDSGFAVDGVQTLYYEGLPYTGKETRVFAYMGIPAVTDGEKVPGIVLVHGGLGKAEADWVKKWMARGYAAIAMDTEGHTPNRQTHALGGPANNGYADISDMENSWVYHGVADIILANNLLRSNTSVDADKIGITGISWGGVLASTAIGVDDRFAFAVPVYGCGYLYESETYFSTVMTPEKAYMDPSKFFTRSTMPILWVNSDHDPHFPLSILTKSHLSTQNHSYMTIHSNLGHSQSEGEKSAEIYTFAGSIVKETTQFIRFSSIEATQTSITAAYSLPSGASIASASLYYTKSPSLVYNGSSLQTVWSGPVQANSISGSTVTFAAQPAAKQIYVNITDQAGNVVTTPLTKIN